MKTVYRNGIKERCDELFAQVHEFQDWLGSLDPELADNEAEKLNIIQDLIMEVAADVENSDSEIKEAEVKRLTGISAEFFKLKVSLTLFLIKHGLIKGDYEYHEF